MKPKLLKKLIFILPVLLLNCTSSRKLYHTDFPTNSNERAIRTSIADLANTYIGTNYRYGGLDGRGLDCSGLVYKVFKEHSITLPRSSAEQLRIGKTTSTKKAQIGDLIFFRQNGRINHVAIVTEVHSRGLWVTHSTTSKGVIHENLNESAYWSSRIEGVRDIISLGGGK